MQISGKFTCLLQSSAKHTEIQMKEKKKHTHTRQAATNQPTRSKQTALLYELKRQFRVT